VTKITRENFTAAMERAVAERGADYKYPTAQLNPEWEGTNPGVNIPRIIADDYHTQTGACFYSTPGGEPACIIGQALFNIDPKLLPKPDLVAGAEDVLYNMGVRDNGLRLAANKAQEAQDDGERWGSALAEFLLQLGEYGPEFEEGK
jgi:hypothetical protein